MLIIRVQLEILVILCITSLVFSFGLKRKDNKQTWLIDSVSVQIPNGKLNHDTAQYQANHDDLLNHVLHAKEVFPYKRKGYYGNKPKSNKARIVIRSALVLGAGATLLKSLTHHSSSNEVVTTQSPTSTQPTSSTTTTIPTTQSTTSASTTASTTSASTTSTTTESTTTTSTTTESTTTTSTTTTSTTTTLPPVQCDRASNVSASSIGEMGLFQFLKEKTPGNLKLCQTITAPPGTKLQVVCTMIDLIGDGTSSNHYLKLLETNSYGAIIAFPPVDNATYSSSSSVLYLEAAVTSADSFSCKWTVVAALLRYWPPRFVWKTPFSWLLPDYILDGTSMTAFQRSLHRLLPF